MAYDPNSPRHSELQSALYALQSWCDTWQLKVAAEKCVTLYLGNQNPHHRYELNNETMSEVVTSVRDLGFITTPDLKTSTHCRYLYKKAMAKAFMFLRRIQSKNVVVLLKVYTTYIRPILESIVAVYNPYLKRDIKLLEKIQNYFTRNVFYRCYPDPGYPATMPSADYRNQRLGLPSLKMRRDDYDLLMCFKIFKGFTKIRPSDLYKSSDTVTRGPRTKIFLFRYKTNCLRSGFCG